MKSAMKRFIPFAAALLLGLVPVSVSYGQNVVARPTTILSSTVTTGNTFQNIAGLAAIGDGAQTRRSVTIQNNNTTTDNCWLFIGPLANATKALSILLAPQQAYTRYYPYVPADNFAITCATNGNSFYADTQ